MRWKEINEAPISHFGTHGDLDTEGSFRASDLNAIKNPKWVKKVTTMFERVPFDINLYFYNAPDGKTDLVRNHQIPDSLRKYLSGQEIPHKAEVNVRDTKDLAAYAGAIEAHRVKPIIGELPKNYSTAINCILVSNEGDGRMAMTPWMVGHRLIHSLFYETQFDTGDLPHEHRRIFDIYGSFLTMLKRTLGDTDMHPTVHRTAYPMNKNDMVNALGKIIGTTRAAREGKHINDGEWLVDICVQWLVRGKVHFNHVNVCGTGPTTPPEETKLLNAARRFVQWQPWNEHRPDEFLKVYFKDHPQEPNPNSPRYQPDYKSYVALTKAGMAMAAGNFTPERIAQYQKDGLTVELTGTGTDLLKRDMKRWKSYQTRCETIRKQWLEWFRAGQLGHESERGSETDKFFRELDRYEKSFGNAIEAYLKSREGRFYIL